MFSNPFLSEIATNAPQQLLGYGHRLLSNSDRVAAHLKTLDAAGLHYRVEGEQTYGGSCKYTIVHIKDGSQQQLEKLFGVKVARSYGPQAEIERFN